MGTHISERLVPKKLQEVSLARYFIIASFIAVFGTASSARAIADDEKPYVLDGQIYRKPELIDNFIRVAFSELPWNSDMTPEHRELMYERFFGPEPELWPTAKSSSASEERIPWFKPHLGENLKLPLNPRNVLNRWDGMSITVGIDWPRYSEPEPKTHWERNAHPGYMENNPNTAYSIKDAASFYPKFTEIIKKQLSPLSDATGADIRFIEPTDKTDRSRSYATIRIIPGASASASHALQMPIHGFHPETYEKTLFNGVLLESVTRSYVYGYLLPDSSLSLDLAICKVDPTLKDVMLAALVHECLVRTLGLPSMSENEESILSYWHSRPEERLNFGRYSFESGGQIIESSSFEGDDERYDAKGKHDEAQKVRKSTQWISLKQPFGKKIPKLDLVMLSFLYCPALKSGMTPEEARAVLQKSEACFQFLERIAAKPLPVSHD